MSDKQQLGIFIVFFFFQIFQVTTTAELWNQKFLAIKDYKSRVNWNCKALFSNIISAQ